LNETVPAALALLATEIRPLVRHQAGSRTLAEAQSAYGQAKVEAEVTPFIADMAEAYGWADLVIGRAGALTLSELAAAGVGSVLVPYPYAVDDHQTKNGAWLADAGAALLLPQPQLDPQRLAELLQPFAEERDRVLPIAEAARSLAMTKAAETVARACMEVAKP